MIEYDIEFTKLRKSTKLSRKEFGEKYGIPYMTLTAWENGSRVMPDYVLRLLEYKVRMDQMQKEKEEASESNE